MREGQSPIGVNSPGRVGASEARLVGSRALLYDLLYDAIALGMWVNTRTLYRVTTIGPVPSRLRHGTLIVSTHRAETDVPLICPSIYLGYGLWRHRRVRPHFAAREDVFERGFFAGFPAGLPLVVRRALYGVGVGRVLARLPMHPVPYPDARRLRLGRALAAVPQAAPLESLLPASTYRLLRERALEAGLAEPRVVGDVLNGTYADVLWRFYRRAELGHAAFDEAWERRAAEATAEIRGLVDLLRSGEVLLVFPEGRPSLDGAIGPVRGGAGMLVRRGRPESVLPVAIAYDPLQPGRPLAFVAFGKPLGDLADDVEASILHALMRTTPLTCGQVVAGRLVDVADSGLDTVTLADLDTRLRAAVGAAQAEGRPVDPVLLESRGRRERLSGCVATLSRLGVARVRDRRSLVVDPEAIRQSVPVGRLALEYASAWAGGALDARGG